MQIREATINDKERWNEFIRANQGGSFLQSWEWGELMATQKEKIWRLIVCNANAVNLHANDANSEYANDSNEEWLAVIFLFKSKLKFGRSILYAPRGPVVNDNCKMADDKLMALIMEKIDLVAKQEQVMNFQLDPYSNDADWERIFDEQGFEKSERDIQPRHTLLLDVRAGEEELLAQMNQKTRYNIGLARKKGVEIEVDNGAYKGFYELLKKTEVRQKIKFFQADYFKEILKVPFVKLCLAKYQGKVIAANIMIFWNDTATYLFGASDYEYRNVMAPHLLQWQAIKDAKKEGLWFYDFWGAAPPESKGREQNWAGFTKFKMGFSPEAEITEYIGTYEKKYQPVKLGLYRFLQYRFKK